MIAFSKSLPEDENCLSISSFASIYRDHRAITISAVVLESISFKPLNSLEPESSIHRKNLARNKLRSGGKEQYRVGNLISTPVTLHRRLFRHSPHKGCCGFFA